MALPQTSALTPAIAGDGGPTLGHHRTVSELRARVALLESVVENFPGGIALFDQDLRMVFCNATLKDMLDFPDWMTCGDAPSMEELLRFNAARGEYGPGEVEDHVGRRLDLVRRREPHCYDRTRPNGAIVEVRGLPLEGGGFVTTCLNVTEQRRTQEMIAHMANHDPLTGLPNRMLFGDRLSNAVAHVKRGGMLAVLYLDLDRFKPVNDTYGHKAGDELLVRVAQEMRGSVRESDTVARIGGDEFAIVQTGIDSPADAGALARRMLQLLSRPMELSGCRVRIGASVGIAIAPEHGLDCDDLLLRADKALYRSKRMGRGRFHFFAPDPA